MPVGTVTGRGKARGRGIRTLINGRGREGRGDVFPRILRVNEGCIRSSISRLHHAI